jgi:hypothetical protein
MPRPFLPNLTITYNLPSSGQFTIDPITGNPVLAVTTFIIKAWVEMQTRDGIKSVADINVGTNPNEIDVKGYSVSPKVLPSNILRSRMEGQAVYVDPVTGQDVVGKFTMTPQIDGNRERVASRVAKVMGTQIKGKFEIQ